MSIFVFRVLPTLEIIQAILVMNAISLVPSLLKLCFKSQVEKSDHINDSKNLLQKLTNLKSHTITLKVNILLNLVAFLMQISFYFLIFIPNLPFKNDWSVYVSIFLVSLSYWENFTSERLIASKQRFVKLSQFKKSIECARHKTLLFVSIWKICLVLLFALIFHPNIFKDADYAFNNDKRVNEHVIALILNVISSFLCYYFSLLACKLCMQRTSFAFSLSISLPIFITSTIVVCKNVFVDSFMFKNYYKWTCTNSSYQWFLLCGIFLWWLSHLWVNKHVWLDVTHRLQLRRR